jgi:thioredoxin-dependent peroxiredoxin
MLKPGDSAPDFSGTDFSGKTHSLADYRGRGLVLWFFPKADPPG